MSDTGVRSKLGVKINQKGEAVKMNRQRQGWKVVFLLTVFVMGVLLSPVSATSPDSPDRVNVLVGFHGTPNKGLVEAFGGEVYMEYDIVDALAVTLPAKAISALERNPLIDYIEEDGQAFALEALPVQNNANDQVVPWGIDRVFGDETYSFDTWDYSTGEGIGVAVLDTGIDENHPDLEDKVVGGVSYIDGEAWGTDDNSHGTHIAGTIAALDNDIGVVGVSPGVSLYDVKVLDTAGMGSLSSVVAGIDWAAGQEEVDILSMSLGFLSSYSTLRNACDNAYAAGKLLVAAAGNSGDWIFFNSIVYPARYNSVIAVAASDEDDRRASFSSTGPQIELIAPGVDVLSTEPGGGYRYGSGTSMATPHVSGVAALVWSLDSELTNSEVRVLLQETAEDLALASRVQGHGMVRADLAVDEVKNGDENGEPEPVVPDTFELTLEVIPAEGGTVTGDGEYDEKEEVTVTAVANEDYGFVNWTTKEGDVKSTNKELTFLMPDHDLTLVANFEEIEVEDPGEPGDGELTVTITTSTRGGRQSDRHLDVVVNVLDSDGVGISGASVSIEITLDEDPYASSTGTTDSNGNVTFSYTNHPDGGYVIQVTDVEADGYTLDGYPEKEYEKE